MGLTNIDLVGERCLATTGTTVNVTFDVGIYFIDTTAGAVTVNLPSLTGRPLAYTTMRDGSFYVPMITFVRVTGGANTITYDGSGSDTVNGAATALHGTTQWTSKTLIANGPNSWVMANSP